MSKQINKFKRITAKLFCGVLFFSFLLINLGFANAEISHLNSTYCPLQKSWVKQKQVKIEKSNLLSNICTSDETKEKIAFEISSKIFTRNHITEDIVFDYLEKGSITLLNLPQNSPNNNFAKRNKFESVSGNSNNTFLTKSFAIVEFEQLARPPSFSVSGYFSPFINKTLKQISCNINPRSPPIFL
jgi:hypothetical protein